MEITVIGSGSSGNAYVLRSGTDVLLLEAGLPLARIRQALGFRLHTVAGLWISHHHGDHAGSARAVWQAGVPVYCLPETAAACDLAGHRVTLLTPRTPVRCGAWQVLPFPVIHDVPTVGFVIQHGADRVLYVTDTAYIPVRVPGLTHVLIEANYAPDILEANVRAGRIPSGLRNRIVRTHMSLDTVMGFLQANDLSRLQQIWLLHLSDANSDATRFQREVSRITGTPTYIAEAFPMKG